MKSYVVLINWTDKGTHNFKDTVDEGKGLAGVASSLGGEVRQLLWTMGAYDAVVMITAPDDETAAAIALAASENGAVRTTTLRAFEREEIENIVERAR